MISAAVQKVDVVHDWMDWVQLLFGVLGALALWFAYRAQKDATRARKEIPAERRRQFELEILRGLLDDLDEEQILHEVEFTPSRLQRYQHRLATLPDSTLPFWRQAMTMDWYDSLPNDHGFRARQKELSVTRFAVVKQLSNDLDNAELKAEADQQAAEISAAATQFADNIRGRLLDELLSAIRERVEADAGQPRGSWTPRSRRTPRG
ncbi:hypothetical protein [Micromonospora sp. NPDC005305]|uniref:hypothetical protein n=1 Tax=Micromonospora sp. NPDC005305 TaxID=3156875 RepID=UPI00339FFACF